MLQEIIDRHTLLLGRITFSAPVAKRSLAITAPIQPSFAPLRQHPPLDGYPQLVDHRHRAAITLLIQAHRTQSLRPRVLHQQRTPSHSRVQDSCITPTCLKTSNITTRKETCRQCPRMYVYADGVRQVRIFRHGDAQNQIDHLLCPCRDRAPINMLAAHGIAAWFDPQHKRHGMRANLNVIVNGRKVTLHEPAVVVKQDQDGVIGNLSKPDIEWRTG